MKVTTVLILISIWFLRIKVTEANYRRIIRGPPQPQRQPPPYMKKWPHPPPPPPRNQLRPRPIPVKLPPSFKKPIGPPVLTNRHLTPVRSIWKNAPQNFQIATEKPFLSSPTISLAEYDYHIQTNNIPTHTNTIKQVGEKGPIHTIPAPNLSLADKPSNIGQVQSIPQIYQPQQIVYQNQQPQQTQLQNVVYKQKQPQHQHTIVEIQKSHQYQVTEEDPGHHQQIKLQPIFYDPSPTIGANEIREVNKLSPSPEQLNNLAHAEFLVAPQPEQAQALSPQELYKLLNLYPQQQLLDSYGLPVAQQPQLQQHLIRQQQAILTSNPQFNNYEEQNQRNVQGKQIVSRVVGDFGVKPEKENSADALAQAQYIQHYFEHPAENIVEADAQATNNFDTNEIPKDAFYSTLPNRQAAEVLASLQEAGKINNSQQVKNVEAKVPMTIYVPDNYEEESEDNEEVQSADEGEQKVLHHQERGEYEDDLLGEANEHAHAHAQYQIDSAYGDRIRTKSQ